MLSWPLSPTTGNGCRPAVSASAWRQSACWPGKVGKQRTRPRLSLRLRSKARGVTLLAGQPAARAADSSHGTAAGACGGAAALDAGIVDMRHIRLSHGLEALHQAVPHALSGPAAEPLLRSPGGRDETPKLGPHAVAPQHGAAGANEAAQAVRVAQAHVRRLRQGGKHALPHRVHNETLPRAQPS